LVKSLPGCRIVDSQEPSLNIAGVLGVFTGDLSFVLGEI